MPPSTPRCATCAQLAAGDALVIVAVGAHDRGGRVSRTRWCPDAWAAAIALGAIVAPPDAAAATAVLRQLQLPHRLLVILEGESLLNDASALLIYRVAVGVAMARHRCTRSRRAIVLALLGSLSRVSRSRSCSLR